MKVRRKIFDQYWKFAAERQRIFFKRLRGEAAPYSDDPIFQKYKFCNAYRASDRVSQFLIRKVIYGRKWGAEDTIFRVLLFRLLNKTKTWEELEQMLGEITPGNFSFRRYDKALSSLREAGPIYGNAFILCANKVFGYEKKHQNHLKLIQHIKENKLAKIARAKSLEQLFLVLRELPLIGNFMAYQMAIDLNYSQIFDFSENDFTVAGPGALRGIRKCFEDLEGKTSKYAINFMVEAQAREFERLGIKFENLWGRPLQAVDCQGLFCEVDKYTRVRYPELKSSRVRMKAKFLPNAEPIGYFYPPMWGINRGR